MRSLALPAEIPSDNIRIIDIAGVSYETPETEYLRENNLQKIRRSVSYLAKNYRDVCVKFYLEEKDYNTISKELGIPLSSVKWGLNQSKIQIREEFSKMDYMANGYRQAVKLKFNMGEYVGNWEPALGNYDNADNTIYI